MHAITLVKGVCCAAASPKLESERKREMMDAERSE